MRHAEAVLCGGWCGCDRETGHAGSISPRHARAEQSFCNGALRLMPIAVSGGAPGSPRDMAQRSEPLMPPMATASDTTAFGSYLMDGSTESSHSSVCSASHALGGRACAPLTPRQPSVGEAARLMASSMSATSRICAVTFAELACAPPAAMAPTSAKLVHRALLYATQPRGRP
eukprot:854206-Prymnesium_polylepis.2